jgi:hypothetical protein
LVETALGHDNGWAQRDRRFVRGRDGSGGRRYWVL